MPTLRAQAALLCLLAALHADAAGPWVRPPGSSWAQLSFSRFVADTPERLITNRRMSDGLRLGLTAEVGLPGQTALTLELPWTRARNSFSWGQTFTNAGFADSTVRLTRALVTEEWPVSASLEGKLPMYQTVASRSVGGIITVNDQTLNAGAFPELGDGNLDLTGRLSIGKSFWPSPSWFSADVGFRYRFGGFAHAVVGAMNLGGWIVQDVVGLGIYGSASKNVTVGANMSREFATLSLYSSFGVPRYLPGVVFGLSVGSTVIANFADTGTDVSVSLSWQR